jgi:hypothetical protein
MRIYLVFLLLFQVRAECSPQSIDSLRHLWLSSDADLSQEFDVLQSLMNEFQSGYQLDDVGCRPDILPLQANATSPQKIRRAAVEYFTF